MSAATKPTRRTHPREYNSWAAMKQRCLNPNSTDWKHYGGRPAEKGGPVVICARWLNSFAAFVADLGERPEGTTLDRRNSRLGYTKANTRFADKFAQSRNRDVVAHVSLPTGAITVSEVATMLGRKPGTVTARRHRGYDTRKAIVAELHVRKKMGAKYNEPELHERSVKYLAAQVGVNYSTVLYRIQRGVRLADALKPVPARARAA